MGGRAPVLLVDIDGVLNCFGSLWTDEHDAVAWELPVFDAEGFEIRVPKGTTRRLAVLAERFEPVWCTSWEKRAHPNFAERLDLGAPWPVIGFARTMRTSTWKLPDVEFWCGPGGPYADRPVAWLDDDLHEDAEAWARDRSIRLGVPTMLCQTEYAKGLGDREVAKLLAFADGCDSFTRSDVPSAAVPRDSE